MPRVRESRRSMSKAARNARIPHRSVPISRLPPQRVGDREPDIAKIKQGWMDGETRVLKERVQIIASAGATASLAKGWTSAE